MRHRWKLLLAGLTLLVCAPETYAAVVLNETFETDTTNLGGLAGWQASYCKDGWRTDLNGGAIANWDDSCQGCTCTYTVQSDGVNDCLGSEPLDNHVQTGNTNWQNYVYTVRFRNADDDTMGVVFRYINSANFYLFFLVQHSAPDAAGCATEFNGARLIRVRDGYGQLLKEVAGLSYTVGQEHAIRVTVVDRHIKVEFDHNSDGDYGPNEVFYDQDDNAQYYLPNGRVGLYTYNNGSTESDNTPGTCMAGGCWFDDLVVDLLPPNNQDCGTVAYEGQCEGNTLKYCDKTGLLKTQNCGAGSCCRWANDVGYYTCVPGALCDSCTNACQPGDKGCSSNLSHAAVCGQGDADGCVEPKLTACPAGTQCDPGSGECFAPCLPDCTGKACGADGCGGICGQCGADEKCVDGLCQEDLPGPMGAPCEEAGDCVTMMCVATDDGQLCSKACTGDAGCPTGFVCVDVKVGGAPLQACVPSGECLPDCTGKECGSNGCDGECGKCAGGFTCKGGACLADAGATCSNASQCASGLCIAYQSGTFCSAPCSTDQGCPDGWTCTPWIQASTPNICAPKSTMVAHDNCAEIAECIDSCPNPACVSSCFFFGSSQAQKDYSGLMVCMQSKCQESCGNDNDCVSACLLDECFQVFATCFPGSTSCSESVSCMGGCGGGDACVEGCYAEAYPAAKKQLNVLLECTEDLCPDGPVGDCLKAAIEGPCKVAWQDCSQACAPVCDGLACGNDGCGGECGDCPSGHVCELGECVAYCQADCDNKDCGDDGCGGSCGSCVEPYTCIAGVCAGEGDCVPQATLQCVEGDSYWFDSCDNQGELAAKCTLGCSHGECQEPPVDTDATTLDDGGAAADVNAVTLSAGKPSGGCSATGESSPAATLLLALMLAAILRKQRSFYA